MGRHLRRSPQRVDLLGYIREKKAETRDIRITKALSKLKAECAGLAVGQVHSSLK